MQLYTKILIGMAVGVVLGLFLGPNSSLLPNDGVSLGPRAQVLDAIDGTPMPAARGLRTARIVEERPGDAGAPTWLRIEWRLRPAEVLRLQAEGTRAVRANQLLSGWVAETAEGVTRFATLGQKAVDSTEWIGRLFLALIKMVVVPLVFLSLCVGVASLGDLRALGRLGGRTIVYFTLTTVVALVIGTGLANLFRPGKVLSADDRAQLLASYEGSVGDTVARAARAPSLTDQLVGIVPDNPIAALANAEMLQIIFFALMLGIAFTMLKPERSQPIVAAFARLNDAVVMLVHMAMKLAPYGVAALLFKVVGSTGLSVLLALGAYALVVVAGLAVHAALTYASVVRLGARLPVLGFLGAIKEALLVAFSTSSSSATLPVTMEACEENLRVSNKITSFVLPLGATVNMDGTALYQGVAAIFIAQIYGLDLGLGAQVTVIASATLASIGAAGVPGAGMITLAMVLTTVGVPTEGLALILGVDRLLDMFRTATNVMGDATATAFMARLEGEDLRILTDAEDRGDPSRGFEGRLGGKGEPVLPDRPPSV